jgi:hypothetical protein
MNSLRAFIAVAAVVLSGDAMAVWSGDEDKVLVPGGPPLTQASRGKNHDK